MGKKLWIIFNAIVIYAGYQGIRLTDFYSSDTFYSITLPMIDIVFLIYMLLLVVHQAYRRTWD